MSTKLVIALDKGIVTLCTALGETLGSCEATTGQPGENDFRDRNLGPIPPGTYTLDPTKIVGGDIETYIRSYKRWKIDDHDWGNYWVPLEPSSNTDTMANDGQPRADFYMHGGRRPGSAGCIDVGSNDARVFGLIKGWSCNDPVLVIVTGCPNKDGW